MPSVNINESTGRVQYTATSGQTEFIYDFVVFAATDLVVIKNGTTLTYVTDYSVSGVGTTAGGTVTLTTGATVADVITIYRNTAISRASQYNPDGRLDAAPLERDFDKITTILQELKRDTDRTVKLPPDDPLDSLTLPADRENKFLSFDANGSPIAVTGSTSTGSPFGATGIDLAATETKAAALTILGISADDQSPTGDWTFNGTVGCKGKFQWQYDGERTLSSNTASTNGAYHIFRTQGGGATDDFDGITTTATGLLNLMRVTSAASETLTLRHNQGASSSFYTWTGLNITMDTPYRIIGSLYDSTLQRHVILFDGTTKEYVNAQITAAKDLNYTSSDQTITAGGQLVLAHGLAAIPDQVNYYLVCQTGENGYTAGDIVGIDFSNSTSGNNSYSNPVVDATNITIRYSSDTAVFFIANKSTGAGVAITPANWLLRVKARKWV